MDQADSELENEEDQIIAMSKIIILHNMGKYKGKLKKNNT